NVTIGKLRTRGAELPPAPQERGGRPDPRPRVRLGGGVHSIKLKNSKKGDRYATFVVEDKKGGVEGSARPDHHPQIEGVIRGGEPVVIAGGLDISEERCTVIADEITPLARARAEAIRQVHVRVPLPGVDRDGLSLLKDILARHPGPCDAYLHLVREDR